MRVADFTRTFSGVAYNPDVNFRLTRTYQWWTGSTPMEAVVSTILAVSVFSVIAAFAVGIAREMSRR